MGPTLILDKSTLQAISINESVFLEHFFLMNVTPLFYIETLGDLALGQHKDGRPIEHIISELAAKISSVGVYPNVHHQRLVLGNLLGQEVEMDGRTIVDGGVTKIDPEGKIGVHFPEPKEQIALARWQKKEYTDLEREISKKWRNALSNISFDYILGIVKNIIPPDIKLSNHQEIKDFLDTFLHGSSKELLLLALDLLDIPSQFHSDIINRWERKKEEFDVFAPYAAFVLKVDLLFYLCLNKGFEDKNRPSHKVDLAYLYYLPFCNVFISTDKIHKRIAPLFLRKDQLYVEGMDFKNGLRILDQYYEQFMEQIQEVGFASFTSQPPKDIPNKVSEIWDKIFPNWRKTQDQKTYKMSPEESKKLVEHLKKLQKDSIPTNIHLPSDENHHFIFTHKSPVQKGRWRILPKGIENQKTEED